MPLPRPEDSDNELLRIFRSTDDPVKRAERISEVWSIKVDPNETYHFAQLSNRIMIEVYRRPIGGVVSTPPPEAGIPPPKEGPSKMSRLIAYWNELGNDKERLAAKLNQDLEMNATLEEVQGATLPDLIKRLSGANR